MFTLLVSWLLVACVPGLLMLVTLGLGRLETEIAHNTVTTTDVDEFLDGAQKRLAVLTAYDGGQPLKLRSVIVAAAGFLDYG